jgi:hypothetical protein
MGTGSPPLYEPVAESVSTAASHARRLQLGVDGRVIDKGAGHITGSPREVCWQLRTHGPPLITPRQIVAALER